MDLAVNLTQEQIELIEQLAGINYTPQEIALFFQQDEEAFMAFFDAPGSKLKYHYDRGKLVAKAKIDMELSKSAQAGNITAAQLIKKSTKAKEHEEFKRRMLDGY